MKRLHRRVQAVGSNRQRAEAGYSQVSGGAASPGGVPMTMPLQLVSVYPQPGGTYSTLAYRGAVPLFTTDGAVVAATQPGRWGQLAMAGRP